MVKLGGTADSGSALEMEVRMGSEMLEDKGVL